MALENNDEDLAAVREALVDLEAGDEGVPMDDAIEMIRKRQLQ